MHLGITYTCGGDVNADRFVEIDAGVHLTSETEDEDENQSGKVGTAEAPTVDALGLALLELRSDSTMMHEMRRNFVLNETSKLKQQQADSGAETAATTAGASDVLARLQAELATQRMKEDALDELKELAQRGIEATARKAVEQQTLTRQLRDALERKHVVAQARDMALWGSRQRAGGPSEASTGHAKYHHTVNAAGVEAAVAGTNIAFAMAPFRQSLRGIKEATEHVDSAKEAALNAEDEISRVSHKYNKAKDKLLTSRKTIASFQGVEREVQQEAVHVADTLRTLQEAKVAVQSAMSDSFVLEARASSQSSPSSSSSSTSTGTANGAKQNLITTHGIAVDFGQRGFDTIRRAANPGFSLEMFVHLEIVNQTNHSQGGNPCSAFALPTEGPQGFYRRVAAGCAVVLASALGDSTTMSDSAMVLNAATDLLVGSDSDIDSSGGGTRSPSRSRGALLEVASQTTNMHDAHAPTGGYCVDNGWYLGFDAARGGFVFGLADAKDNLFHELVSTAGSGGAGSMPRGDTWQHVVASFDGEQVRLFVDGTLTDYFGGRSGSLLRKGAGSFVLLGARTGDAHGTRQCIEGATPALSSLLLSSSSPGQTSIGNVQVDDVALWGRVLSAQDLQNHADHRQMAGVSLPDPGSEIELDAFYNFGPGRSSPNGQTRLTQVDKLLALVSRTRATMQGSVPDEDENGVRDAVDHGRGFLDGTVWHQPPTNPLYIVQDTA